jgi:hypothetical protein
MLGWARCGSHKKHVGTCYDEHVFLHLEGYAGPVVRYGPCMTLNIDALFFIPWWARCGSHKKCAEIRYVEHVFLHPV